MQISVFSLVKKNVILCVFLLSSNSFVAQTTRAQDTIAAPASEFWKKVRFGGGVGLSFGNFTEVSLAPMAIYNVNSQFSIGMGLQYSYVSSRDVFTSSMYGASVISLFNVSEAIQLSAELEQLNVNRNLLSATPNIKENFWNTGLFMGAGYNNGNFTIGGRYNLLFNKDRNVYGTAFMPFVRVFF